MSGLEFLEKLMRLRPMPVIMVSTLTRRGAEETIQALEIGAIDCIEKPRPGNEHSFEELPFKVKIAASARVRPLVKEEDRRRSAAGARAANEAYVPDGRVIAIGASTGGVEALLELLSGFPENCPPTVITQHMPPAFTRSFANRLDRLCAPKVQEATDKAKLLPGNVFLAPGGLEHLEVLVGPALPTEVWRTRQWSLPIRRRPLRVGVALLQRPSRRRHFDWHGKGRGRRAAVNA